MPHYRVDELARRAGTTVRNVRAYQERGLLPPPRREGRVALYDEAHLGRLRVVNRLLDRGYTSANIAELLTGWETGRDLAGVLGLETALSELWPAAPPRPVSRQEIGRLFGCEDDTGALVGRLVAAGLITRDDGTLTVSSPRVLHAAAGLVAAGVPLPTVLSLATEATSALDRLAGDLVRQIIAHVVDAGAAPGGLPDDEAVDRTAAALRGLGPAVTSGVTELLARSFERHILDVMGNRAKELLAGREAPDALG
jgi:DNA-binding transcriptional MerR regulator